METINEDELDDIGEKSMLEHNDGLYDESDVKKPKPYAKAYRKKIIDVLDEFTKNPQKYFESDLPKMANPSEDMISQINESNQNNLKKYSPKMYKMLEAMMDEENIGLHLMYSNFRNLGGIAIFTRMMDYYGFTRFR